MKKISSSIANFIKKELVLSIAILLTIITCFFVPPDKNYIDYFDFTTLATLFSMLAVVAGLKKTNIFELISRKLIMKFHTRKSIILVLVFGTFFFDMIVANDMSLITFLPLTYIVLHSTGNDKYLAFTFIMQTIAANMGGMITPYGNPQNLYLYSYYNINTFEFFSILFFYTIVVAFLLLICISFIKNENLELKEKENFTIDRKKLTIYSILFIIVILSIFRIIPTYIMLITCIITFLLTDFKILYKVDYALLATFFVFFIFSGNMARIDIIKDFFSEIVNKNTLVTGILSCQLISNVPTAIFLSKFTNNYKDLLISVNIGSLGILISSLASLITLKEFLKHMPKKFKEYILLFTLFNTLFLFALLLLNYITKYISI